MARWLIIGRDTVTNARRIDYADASDERSAANLALDKGLIWEHMARLPDEGWLLREGTSILLHLAVLAFIGAALFALGALIEWEVQRMFYSASLLIVAILAVLARYAFSLTRDRMRKLLERQPLNFIARADETANQASDEPPWQNQK